MIKPIEKSFTTWESDFNRVYHDFILAVESAEAHLELAHINDDRSVSNSFLFARSVHEMFFELLGKMKDPDNPVLKKKKFTHAFIYCDHKALEKEVHILLKLIKDEGLSARLKESFKQLTVIIGDLWDTYHDLYALGAFL